MISVLVHSYTVPAGAIWRHHLNGRSRLANICVRTKTSPNPFLKGFTNDLTSFSSGFLFLCFSGERSIRWTLTNPRRKTRRTPWNFIDIFWSSLYVFIQSTVTVRDVSFIYLYFVFASFGFLLETSPFVYSVESAAQHLTTILQHSPIKLV